MKSVFRSKVLITGINGFTGIHLEQFFIALGYDVYGTVIDTPTNSNHYQCDITQLSQIDKVLEHIRPDFVIHIAAISFVGESNASLIYDVNVIGTQNLLESLITHNIEPKKVILASSATVYGNQGKEVLDESMTPQPVNHYGCSKLAMEHISANYFDKLPIIIVRPFNYTGLGQADHFLIPKIVKHYKEASKTIELGNLHVAREFNSIEFIMQSYYKLMISKESSLVVNLSSNQPIKLLDVIEQMNTIAGYSIKVEVNPAFVRPNDIASLAGCTDKLESIIGTLPKLSLVDTLTSMYND